MTLAVDRSAHFSAAHFRTSVAHRFYDLARRKVQHHFATWVDEVPSFPDLYGSQPFTEVESIVVDRGYDNAVCIAEAP